MGALLGYAGSYLLTTQWEGIGYLRVGRMDSGAGALMLIEPPQAVAERLKVRPFLQAVAKAVNPREPETLPGTPSLCPPSKDGRSPERIWLKFVCEAIRRRVPGSMSRAWHGPLLRPIK